MNTKTNAFKSILAIALCAVGFAASAADPITYLDWDAATQQLVEKTITDYTVYNGEGELDAGTTYVVKSSLGDWSIYVCGTESSPSRLILCDGVKLTEGEGIYIEEGGALIICGQAGGTGELVATGYGCAGIGSDGGCTVTINGGIVTATGGSYCAGIGSAADYSGGKVTINGGTVKATGKNGAAGIGGGNKAANSGTVAFGAKFNVLAGSNAAGAKPVEQTAYASNHSAAYVSITPIFGSEGNPWKVGAPNAADVTAYTNGVGGLVVKGAGDMKDFAEIKDVPWGQGIASVTIDEGVTGIGAMSFNGSALGSVTIPASVTKIGAAAFGACASLSKVELKALTPPTLGGDAFAGCAEGLKIYVPCGAGKAYRAAWSDHASRIIETIKVKSDEFTVDLRTSVNLVGETTVSNVAWSATAWGKVPETFTTVGYTNLSTGATGVFGNLSNIMGEGAKDAVLPAKDGEYILTHSTGGLLSFAMFTVSNTGNPVGSESNPWKMGAGVGDTVVAYRNGDGELVIGGSGAMKDFSEGGAPWDPSGITSVTIGRNVTAIGDYAFYGYAKLTNVTFATGALLESIGSHAFAGCPSMLALEVPANVTNCGPAVIVGTPNVTVSEDNETFAIVGGVLCDVKSNKVISGLDAADVTIPEPMVEIGECAFSTNSALTSVTIPATMMAIGKDAFRGCANLTKVFVRAEDPPTLGEDAFKGCNDGLKIYVPDGKGETYKAAAGWSDYAGKINEMPGEGTKVSPWTVGTGVTAYIENGTLHIEGFGAMKDFTAANPAPWAAFASDIEAIQVETGVTKVGNAAFAALDFMDTTSTLAIPDDAHELNLLAFVSADGSATNAPWTSQFRVVRDGRSESAAAFGPKDSTAFYGTVGEALTYGDATSMLMLTLAETALREKDYLTDIAGEKPYSKQMEDILTEAITKLNEAEGYGDVQDVHTTYADKIEAQAGKDESHEISGTDITWRVLDGSLVIEGEGEMPDFSAGAPWDAYAGDISNATVAAGIESLGAAAFAKCPTGTDKMVFFANPKAEIKLAAFVSNDGTATNDFTAAQIWLPDADGDEAAAVKLLGGTDSDAPRYDSIAEAIEAGEVTSVVAYTLDGLKDLAETWISEKAGLQPWTERVAAAVETALGKIEQAADADIVWQAGIGGYDAVKTAQDQDAQDTKLGGTIPGSDVTWKLVGGELVLNGSGAMPEALAPAPWNKSKSNIGTIVVGEGVTGLSKGLFTSDLSAPAETVIFESKTVLIPRDAFVDAGWTVNDEVAVLFATETDGVNEAPCGWTDAADTTKTYDSYAEAFEAGATAVKPIFAVSSGTVEERIEKAPAVIVEKVQPVDEAGRFIWGPNGDLIDVVTVVENINTNGVETSERIVASKVDGLAGIAQAEASESGCTVVTLTVDAQSADPENRIQERMIWEMTDGEGFEAKFAEIVLATNDVPVAESKALVEIHIPYETEGRENFSVTRLHDGKVEVFTEIFDPADKADATFMVGKNEVVVWTDKFSLYAISSTLPDELVISFDAMGGKFADGSEVVTNFCILAYTMPETPTRADYTFLGWYDSWKDGAAVVTNGQDLISYEAHSIYAKWKSVKFEPSDDEEVIKTDGNGVIVAQDVEPTGELVLPEMNHGGAGGVANVEIGDDAFLKNTGITSVSLPVFVKKIGAYAFANATGISKINFVQPRDATTGKNTTLTIGDGAFSGLSLTKIELPPYVASIGAKAFAGNTKLTDLTIMGPTTIDWAARPFLNCGTASPNGKVTLHLAYEVATDKTYATKLWNYVRDYADNIQIDFNPYGTARVLDSGPTFVEFEAKIDTPWPTIGIDSVKVLTTTDLGRDLENTWTTVPLTGVTHVEGDTYLATFANQGEGTRFYQIAIVMPAEEN